MNLFIDFLLEVYKLGRSYSTVNTYRSGISTTIHSVTGRNLGSNHLVSRFMKGIYVAKPPLPRYTATWNVSKVTDHLRTLVPLESLLFKDLSKKLVLLFALSSAQRVQTLQALNINNMSIEETKIVFTVVQRLKTSRPGHNSLRVLIPKVLRNKSICPYTHLLHYIDISSSLRKLSDSTQLFISLNKPHKGVTSSSLARWIKDILQVCGVDTSVFKAHSTRSAATSKAFLHGASIAEILKLANWSNEKTFTRYYHRSVASDTQLGEMILT